MHRTLRFAFTVVVALSGAACGGTVNSGSAGAAGSGGSAGAAGASGAAGTAGAAGASAGAAGSSAGGPCTDESQCKLVNDCCTCEGIGATETAPVCDLTECKTSQCSLDGIEGNTALCKVGQCIAGFKCDPKEVACNGLPPDCPDGETPSVKGLCWGGCVKTTECETVGSCDQCGTDACVIEAAQIGPKIHCVKMPSACSGEPSCECMGKDVCVGIYDQCLEGDKGAINCYCPAC